MATRGADVEQLRALSKTMADAAVKLGQISSQTSSQLSSTGWRGPDATRFRNQWNSQSVSALKAAAGSLNDASSLLRANADEQDQASSATGGSAGATTGVAQSAGENDRAAEITHDAFGLGAELTGLAGDLGTIKNALRGVKEAAEMSPLATALGAAGVVASGDDLLRRLNGIANGNMDDFLGGLLDVGSAGIGVASMLVPEVRVPFAVADVVVTAASDVVEAAGDHINDAVDAVGNAVADAAGAVGDAVGDAAGAVGDAVGDAAGAVGDAAGAVGDAVGDAAGAVGDAVGKGAAAVGKGAEAVGKGIGDIWHKMTGGG